MESNQRRANSQLLCLCCGRLWARSDRAGSRQHSWSPCLYPTMLRQGQTHGVTSIPTQPSTPSPNIPTHSHPPPWVLPDHEQISCISLFLTAPSCPNLGRTDLSSPLPQPPHLCFTSWVPCLLISVPLQGGTLDFHLFPVAQRKGLRKG